MKTLRRMTILSFMCPFAIVLTLAPRRGASSRTGRADTRTHRASSRSPSPKTGRSSESRSGTQFRSPDETSLLMIVAVPAGPPADMKVPTDDLLAEAGSPFFDGYSKALADEDRYEDLKVGPRKKGEFQGHPCLRQDFSYRRKASPTPRESSAFFFVAGNITLFIAAEGTIDGVKTSRSYMKTLTVGNAKAPPTRPSSWTCIRG